MGPSLKGYTAESPLGPDDLIKSQCSVSGQRLNQLTLRTLILGNFLFSFFFFLFFFSPFSFVLALNRGIIAPAMIYPCVMSGSLRGSADEKWGAHEIDG